MPLALEKAYDETMILSNLENIKAADEGEKFGLAMEDETTNITTVEVVIKHTTLESIKGDTIFTYSDIAAMKGLECGLAFR